jgi:hypothetical protein
MSDSSSPPEQLPIEAPPIDPAALAASVRRATGAPEAELATWAVEPLPYQDFGGGSRLLQRVSGTARVGRSGAPVAWSMVVKSFQRTADDLSSDEAGDYAYWRREASLYASGLLDDLPPGIRGPRCYGVERGPEREVVWLEDVQELYPGGWSLDRFGLAARHLGRFNGAFLGRDDVVHLPWMADLRSVLEFWAINDATQPGLAAMLDPEAWSRTVSAAGLREAREPTALRRLLVDRTPLLQALAELPSTLCHHDATAPNLFAARSADGSDATVAIDWQLAGPGPLGAELAMLVAGSVLFHRAPGASIGELDALALDGYIAGLADVGVAPDPGVIEFAAAAAAVLRMSAIVAAWVRNLVTADDRSWSAEFWKRPADELAEQWGPLVGHLEEQARLVEAWLDRPARRTGTASP